MEVEAMEVEAMEAEGEVEAMEEVDMEEGADMKTNVNTGKVSVVE